jgi:hypothetical protein
MEMRNVYSIRLVEVTCGRFVSAIICGNGTGLQVQHQSKAVRFFLYHFNLNYIYWLI